METTVPNVFVNTTQEGIERVKKGNALIGLATKAPLVTLYPLENIKIITSNYCIYSFPL